MWILTRSTESTDIRSRIITDPEILDTVTGQKPFALHAFFVAVSVSEIFTFGM